MVYQIRIGICHFFLSFVVLITLLTNHAQAMCVLEDLPIQLNSVPAGTTKHYSEEDWGRAIHFAKAQLVEALDSSQWRSAGKDGDYRVIIENPNSLPGEVIAGVTQSADESTVTTFAGEVPEVNNINFADDRQIPVYLAKVKGAYGEQGVTITGAFLVQILRR